MNDYESVITISGAEYVELIKDQHTLDMLMRAIYVGANLSWDGKSLSIDGLKLTEFLEVVDSARYQQVLETLKAEGKAEKEAANESV